MSNLTESIRVNTNYTRSINLERDSEQDSAIRPYVITTRAKQILARIADSLSVDEAPRSWALIGPYGSGKSAFGLFLSRLLGGPSSAGSKYACRTLKDADPKLSGDFQKHLRKRKGFCCVALTGSPEPLANRLVRAMSLAAESFFDQQRGRKPKIIQELRDSTEKSGLKVSEIVDLVDKLQESVSRAGGRGVLIVIDELGKFLEYEARHRGATDIFLLQALAEHSVRVGAAPLILIVLLHQAIELYAQSLGEQLKNEWKKVQGRFEAVPFLESTEQTLRVIKAAISTDLPGKTRAIIEKEASRFSKALADLGALPSGLTAKEAQDLFSSCYPLHPVSLLILPTLCQRVAQNERTLFSYLGSLEPFGFFDSVSRLQHPAKGHVEWIRPSSIYEYFILNQPGLISDQATHRRWAEVTTALDRLGDAIPAELDLLKTIGLLNIIGAQGGLKASEEVLALSVSGDTTRGGGIKKLTRSLVERSIVMFRRFSHEYRVWQGSDFDLEAALRDQRAQIGQIDVADVLNDLMPLSPIVARRHTIESGTLRYFSPVFVSAKNLAQISRTEAPVIYIGLAESAEHEEILRNGFAGLGIWHSPGVITGSGLAVRDAVTDVLALRRVQQQSPELANDPIAQRELKDRQTTALQVEYELIGAIFDEPENGDWVIGGKIQRITSKRELQIKLSYLLDTVYDQAPIIKNELINRERPSSTAIAGRKKLLVAMLEEQKVEDLGIEKFPAEKAMYRAVLLATGLHVFGNGHWQFQAPKSSGNDPSRLQPMWDSVINHLESQNGAPVALGDIYKKLSQPPFGIKAGLLPILFLAMYQGLRQELALSEQGQFVPFLTTEVLEGIIRDPEAFALQRFSVDASYANVFAIYAEAITGERSEDVNLIAILQPLAKAILGLPDYTKHTKRISDKAAAIRDLFFSSKAPLSLLFVDFPKALGFDGADLRKDPAVLKSFSVSFREVLTELRSAYHALLLDFAELVRSSCGIDARRPLDEMRSAIRGRCVGLDEFTIDPQCKAFIGRLVDPYGDETQWLVSLASFLARKPPEKWIDDDLIAAKHRLTEFADRVRDLRQLGLHYENANRVQAGDLEASLIRVVSTRGGENQALVTLDDRGRKAVRDHVAGLEKALKGLPTNELKLAALAQVVKELLATSEQGKNSDSEVEKSETRKGAA